MPRLLIVIPTALLALVAALPAQARDGFGGHFDRFHHGRIHRDFRFHSHVFLGFGAFGAFGAPFFPWTYAPYPYPYPYAYAYAYPPPPAYDPGYAPPATVAPPPPGPPQSAPPPADAAPPPEQQGWYYCPPSQSYYPYVQSCAVDWQRVPTTPPPSAPGPGAATSAPVPPAAAPASDDPTAGAKTALQAFLRELREPERQAEPRLVQRFKNAAGRECQEFTQSIVIDGTRQQATGTVCQNKDGRWVIAPSPPPIHAARPQPQG